MNTTTKRTFAKTESGKLIVLEDVQAAFSNNFGSILLNSNCDVIDFLSVNKGDATKHFEVNIKNLESIGNVKQRLTLPEGGFIKINLIKTVILNKDKTSVLIIGINEQIIYGFKNDVYSDLDGLLDSIQDAVIALSSSNTGEVDWSAYTQTAATQKINSPASAKKENEPAPLAPAK